MNSVVGLSTHSYHSSTPATTQLLPPAISVAYAIDPPGDPRGDPPGTFRRRLFEVFFELVFSPIIPVNRQPKPIWINPRILFLCDPRCFSPLFVLGLKKTIY